MLNIIILLVLLLFLPFPVQAADKSFDIWLNGLKKEAEEEGISRNIVEKATKGIKPIARVLELDRKQPEGSMTFAQYKKRVINNTRVEQGKKLYKQHKEFLTFMEKQYGVPGQYIIALWGIETSYGKNTGGFNVVEALATLAYDGRRSKFFRNELIAALKILDEGHIDPKDMKGSWAGAMGQNQFMPSSFHAFAVDGDGSGNRDIWTSLPDVFASSANYLRANGWKAGERWGREVRVPADFDKNLLGLKVRRDLKIWKKMGVKLPNGKDITVIPDMKASIIAPDGVNGKIYIVYDNYRVIMKWNKSIYFATSVGLLADKIAENN